MESNMKIIEVWVDDENTEFWYEDAKGNRFEITAYNYDEIGSSGFDVLQHAMQKMAHVLDFQYDYEEQEIIEDETIDDFIDEGDDDRSYEEY
jgi:hypothetical protein